MALIKLQNGQLVADVEFDTVYPGWVRTLSRVHWTPVAVAALAARLLVRDRGVRVLDIGSGAGKFCLVASCTTGGHFDGVEQRSSLVAVAQDVAAHYNLENLRFHAANMVEVPFSDYEAFYFYNSFAENLYTGCRIDDSIQVNPRLYHRYSNFLRDRFHAMPSGTSVVTYHGHDHVPDSYKLAGSYADDLLRWWVKRRVRRAPVES